MQEVLVEDSRLICGDCLDVLKTIDTGSVDFIITDPPYGIDFQSRRAVDANNYKEKIKGDKRPFIWFLYDAARVLKIGGGMLCFSRWDVQQIFIKAMELAGLTVKNVLVWDKKTHTSGDLKGDFGARYETIIFATKGRYLLPGKRPENLLVCPAINSHYIIHPNQKPVELIKQLIEQTTKPDELILDPFMGIGTTCQAAIETGRRSIGIELDERYFDIAVERCKSI